MNNSPEARVVGRSNTISMVADTPQKLRDMAELLERTGHERYERIDANGHPTLRVTTRDSMGLGPLVEFGLLV